MALFHKNAVITGLLDSYCLLCEVHLRNEEDTHDHIADLRHKKHLESSGYLEKYKDDMIRKVKQGYYCAYCNKLFHTFMKVRMHINGGEHRKNKGLEQLRLEGDTVVAFDMMVIDADAWHGVVDGSCAICNTDYDEKQAHITTPTHILKLVQSSVEVDSNMAIYRLVGDSFHCLICNDLFSLNTLKTHLEDPDHLIFQIKCCETYKNKASHEKIINITTPEIIEILSYDDDDDNDGNNNEHKEDTTHPETTNNGLDSTVDVYINTATPEIIEIPPYDDDDDGNNNEYKEDTTHSETTNNGLDSTVEIYINTATPEIIEIPPYDDDDDGNNNEYKKDTTHPETTNNGLDSTVEIYINTATPEIIEIPPYDDDVGNNNEYKKDITHPETTNNGLDSTVEIYKLTENSQSNESSSSIIEDDSIIKESNENGEVNGPTKIKDNRARRAERAKIFAEENKLKYTEDKSSVSCSTCNVTISSSLKSMKNHIAEISHTKKVEALAKLLKKAIPTEDYLAEVYIVRHYYDLYAVINRRFCISKLSFTLMTDHITYLRCQACEMNLYKYLFDLHRQSESHRDAFKKIPVVLYSKSEFVRQVRPGFYHCGFCNIIEDSWSGMLQHLKSEDHAIQKVLANRRLGAVLPEYEKRVFFYRLAQMMRIRAFFDDSDSD
ncbi:uncharacterized protein [Epargyreus clarus]|uniref:uncharacterized protein n=1 Tax=Epargyreus clarus TaxID=520877 RepID=UPI003C300147